MVNYLNKDEVDQIILDPNNKTINFDQIERINFPRVDINNCVITGTVIKSVHSFGKGNLLNCELRDLNANEISFEYVDIKDCVVMQSKFLKGNFDFGAFINNVFQRCYFGESHFHNLSITESKFYHVDFVDCNLQNMVIKGCTFHNCRFVNCSTSNKLIETSSVFDCIFENTDIQVETITENFGISRENLISVNIRSGRTRDQHTFLDISDLLNPLTNKNYSAFDLLKLEYFLDKDLFIRGDKTIDQIFQLDNWMILCRIPSSFTNLLELLLDFLLYEYEKDRLILFILLKFHEMTSNLVEQVKMQHELYKSVIGVHMSLARIMETFLTLLFSSAKLINTPELKLKVVGPIDIKYYSRELDHFLLPGQISISDVKKMNSPNILSLLSDNMEAITIVLSVLFSTRLKIELSKYYPNSLSSETLATNSLILPQNTQNNVPTRLEEVQLFNIELGLSKAKKDDKHIYSIKLRSIMPGNLMTTLRLDVNTAAIGKVRRILVDIIKKDD